MTCWQVLGIEPTPDERVIKRAYAVLLKKTRPDQDKEGFIQLRSAYEQALSVRHWISDDEVEDDDVDTESDRDDLQVAEVPSDTTPAPIGEHTAPAQRYEDHVWHEHPNFLSEPSPVSQTVIAPVTVVQLINNDIYANEAVSVSLDTQGYQLPVTADIDDFYIGWEAAETDAELLTTIQADVAHDAMIGLDLCESYQSDLMCWLLDQEAIYPETYAFAKQYFGWHDKKDQWQQAYPWDEMDGYETRCAQANDFERFKQTYHPDDPSLGRVQRWQRTRKRPFVTRYGYQMFHTQANSFKARFADLINNRTEAQTLSHELDQVLSHRPAWWLGWLVYVLPILLCFILVQQMLNGYLERYIDYLPVISIVLFLGLAVTTVILGVLSIQRVIIPLINNTKQAIQRIASPMLNRSVVAPIRWRSVQYLALCVGVIAMICQALFDYSQDLTSVLLLSHYALVGLSSIQVIMVTALLASICAYLCNADHSQQLARIHPSRPVFYTVLVAYFTGLLSICFISPQYTLLANVVGGVMFVIGGYLSFVLAQRHYGYAIGARFCGMMLLVIGGLCGMWQLKHTLDGIQAMAFVWLLFILLVVCWLYPRHTAVEFISYYLYITVLLILLSFMMVMVNAYFSLFASIAVSMTALLCSVWLAYRLWRYDEVFAAG